MPSAWKTVRVFIISMFRDMQAERDFIADATVRGGALRMLTILDEHTRECHVLRADRALRSEDVLEWLKKAIMEHGAPEYLRSDNGAEFIAKIVQQWLAENRIKYSDQHRGVNSGFQRCRRCVHDGLRRAVTQSRCPSTPAPWNAPNGGTFQFIRELFATVSFAAGTDTLARFIAEMNGGLAHDERSPF